MQFWKKFWNRKKIETPSESLEQQENEEQYFVDFSQVNLSDEYERKRYVSSLLEQIRDAQQQVEQCEAEYKTVDSYLLDMEEIGYISGQDKEKLHEYAKAIHLLERDKIQFEEKTHRMSDENFAKMQRLADDTDEGVQKIREAEKYQELIRSDLKKLESEKQACIFRRQDAKIMMENLRGMAIISCVAAFCCFIMLIGMQFLMQMDVRIGYILIAAAAALTFLVVYMKYNDASNENIRASRSLNKVILLQNTVKIRYVNNTNLLDYLYLKFGITSGRELESLREQYLQEKDERERIEEAMQDLTYGQEQLVKLLRKYQLHDPLIWIHQVEALLDPKEMVEVRHALITRRQKIRKRIEFNTKNAENAQNQIKEMVADYPQYAKETLVMVSDFEEKNAR